MEIYVSEEEIMEIISSEKGEEVYTAEELNAYEDEFMLLKKILADMAGARVDESDPRYYEYLNKYNQQIEAYEGFHVDPVNVRVQKFVGSVRPLHPMDICANKAARFAVEKYNKTQLVDVKFKKLVKANLNNEYGWAYYLTLEDMDGCYYEARLSQNMADGLYGLDFFRVAKHYNMKE